MTLLAASACTTSTTPVSTASRPQNAPVISYVLKIDPADSGIFDVTMRVRNAPRNLRLAMAVHPEYNQRYWRFVRDISAQSSGIAAPVTRDRENVWTVTTDGREATIHYRIALEPENPLNRAAWHSFLTPTGASVNTTDTFLYPLDFPDEPARVTLDIPAAWRVVTSLSDTFNQRELTARSSYDLVDSPLLLGELRIWSFTVRSVPHRVAYWPLPNAAAFDTTEFVGAIERLAISTVDLFGGAPYRSYTFLFQDGAFGGGLEHVSSAQLGAQSTDLARNPRHYMGEIAHEFFHTWNLMALDPLGPNKITADPPTAIKELWFSEGATMYFAAALLRQAGAMPEAQSRVDDLQDEIEYYFANAGNTHVSPERGSLLSVYGSDSAGDYLSSIYTQGRLISEMLDIILHDSTNGRRGMSDVMRAMYARYANKSGFTGADIERVTNEVCGCNVHNIFENHVRNARPIEFDRHLRSLGLRVTTEMVPATAADGKPQVDLRLFAYERAGRMRVRILHPATSWRTAGLHTGMEIVAIRGIPIDSFPDFRRAVRSARIGDTVAVDVLIEGKPRRFLVPITGYDRPRVRIVERPDATPAQRQRRLQWEAVGSRSGL